MELKDEVSDSDDSSKRDHHKCIVRECRSTKLNTNVSFHRFPKKGRSTVRLSDQEGKDHKLDLLEAWKIQLQISNSISKKWPVVCSEHFLPADFIPKNTVGRRRLKLTAVPSQKLNSTQGFDLYHSSILEVRNMEMTKKRRFSGSAPVKMEIKEENMGGNDYLMAKGRLKGVLKQLTEKSSDEESESSDEGQKTRRKRSDKKRKNQVVPTPYHHTYVMKLYDRSVDLARFEEETPLYPLCRAWMDNQPKNPQKIIKRRVSSPEPDNISWNDSTVDVRKLPRASKPFDTRIPSPLPDQMEQDKDNINLNYDECPPVDKNTLIRDHLQRWVKVKKKWIETASKNEERYQRSFNVLQTIYNKAQEIGE